MSQKLRSVINNNDQKHIPINDVEQIVRVIRENSIITDELEAQEYGYQNLPLCIVDAIFSLREPYKLVQKTVSNFVRYWDANVAPPMARSAELKLACFVAWLKLFSASELASAIFIDNHKAPGCGHLLKAEVVVNFADVLAKSGIETQADILKPHNVEAVKGAVLQTKGIGSVGLRYLRMLSGDEDEAKPDTWILSFLKDILRRNVSESEAVALLRHATERLQADHPALTLRAVDHAIWVFKSGHEFKRC